MLETARKQFYSCDVAPSNLSDVGKKETVHDLFQTRSKSMNFFFFQFLIDIFSIPLFISSDNKIHRITVKCEFNQARTLYFSLPFRRFQFVRLMYKRFQGLLAAVRQLRHTRKTGRRHQFLRSFPFQLSSGVGLHLRQHNLSVTLQQRSVSFSIVKTHFQREI